MASPELEPLAVVLFRAGGAWCGLEAERVCGAERALGHSAADDIETRLALRVPARGVRYRLCLRGARNVWYLNVAAPLELTHMPAGAIRPLPPLLAARAPLPGLRALALRDGQLVLLLDARALAPDTSGPPTAARGFCG